MFALLRRLFCPPPSAAAQNAYIALVTRARNPFFYESLGVPDTLDGRFELVLVHLFLLQHRLLRPPVDAAAESFSRELGELFFADMDHSLREIGVADTGVRYRIKAMAKAYHGRLQVYTASIGEVEQLKTALARNLYGTVSDGDSSVLTPMANYVMQMAKGWDATETKAILSGDAPWAPLN